MPVIGQLIDEAKRPHQVARKDALSEWTNDSFWPVRRSPAQRARFGSDQVVGRNCSQSLGGAETAIFPTAVINEQRNFPLAVRLHSISKIISTSTALLEGSPAIPTAERACFPIASPKTSTIKSEKPFTTRG